MHFPPRPSPRASSPARHFFSFTPCASLTVPPTVSSRSPHNVEDLISLSGLGDSELEDLINSIGSPGGPSAEDVEDLLDAADAVAPPLAAPHAASLGKWPINLDLRVDLPPCWAYTFPSHLTDRPFLSLTGLPLQRPMRLTPRSSRLTPRSTRLTLTPRCPTPPGPTPLSTSTSTRASSCS